ncbi:dTDP-glucose 4,6-dehydratase [Treponema phagedenis]|uniref:dTDP-glucose 4,6-dehydratase n=1 Tax=Treponema phagedenis TaxID=162 RepID=A0A0B7GSC0_TREPH|nr:dTDP-glucose 4,6-dehydratase [Treponema phagedenis]NVP23156.1 dTDP-glucose 4,6-dehydratase [Treponema phagedenis]QEK01276.1 dTDP-glucose 4,6-dehydratase [Treponema phagedenis]QEK06294.1 dTDP-glucose 4,6-dehydratase [Treponema phagedenis]QKS92649.1 dTDP-glucose 4,6-dehydratase [Treponema phagedenis]QLC58020.1 dTDP-glucose 4,6-dehydratase [Treponema phagedenis]
MRSLKNILVTGGAGFIGSNFIHSLLNDKKNFTGRIINLDALTYAGNALNLDDVEKTFGTKRYSFVHGNICDKEIVDTIFNEYNIDTVVNFAAESHVDRSILGPEVFLKTNVLGTFTLLEIAKKYWQTKDGSMREDVLFHHISTDEVYGSLGAEGLFKETTPYDPRSPYSASKASSDHIVKAYFHTYGLPVTISNCSNNYGPFQFPEKLIPLMILNMLEGKDLPVYGDGKQIRDWIHVKDHNEAVFLILENGRLGETYNIGGENEWENIKLLHKLIEIVCSKAGLDIEKVKSTITHVTDRLGHDRRYAIDCTKIKQELGWHRNFDFESGLTDTVNWYLNNKEWINNVRSGEYRNWIEKNYIKR